jgi:hypothetical protein
MDEEKLSAGQIQAILEALSPAVEGLYYFLPDKCWMTEKTMAKALNTNTRVISEAKKELEEANLITIIREENNYKRISQIHTIIKVLPWDMLLIPRDYV